MPNKISWVINFLCIYYTIYVNSESCIFMEDLPDEANIFRGVLVILKNALPVKPD